MRQLPMNISFLKVIISGPLCGNIFYPFACSNQNIPPPLSPWTIICFLVIFLLVVDSSVFFQFMVSNSTPLLSFVVLKKGWDSCLIYDICVCLRIVVSNTFCVVVFVLFVFILRLVYLMLPVSLDCPFLIM